jgi:hypothetical protein
MLPRHRDAVTTAVPRVLPRIRAPFSRGTAGSRKGASARKYRAWLSRRKCAPLSETPRFPLWSRNDTSMHLQLSLTLIWGDHDRSSWEFLGSSDLEPDLHRPMGGGLCRRHRVRRSRGRRQRQPVCPRQPELRVRRSGRVSSRPALRGRLVCRGFGHVDRRHSRLGWNGWNDQFGWNGWLRWNGWLQWNGWLRRDIRHDVRRNADGDLRGGPL